MPYQTQKQQPQGDGNRDNETTMDNGIVRLRMICDCAMNSDLEHEFIPAVVERCARREQLFIMRKDDRAHQITTKYIAHINKKQAQAEQEVSIRAGHQW